MTFQNARPGNRRRRARGPKPGGAGGTPHKCRPGACGSFPAPAGAGRCANSVAMSHSARITMPCPASAQFTAISPSLVLRLPRTLTVSRALAQRQAPGAVGFAALADADAVVAGQVVRHLGSAMRGQVGGRGAQQAPVGRQVPGQHPRIRRLAKAHAHIEGVIGQRRRIDRQLQLDLHLRDGVGETPRSAARYGCGQSPAWR